MNRFFYARLAAANIRKNKSIYTPYLLAASLIVALFYILRSVRTMVLESGMEGGTSMGQILEFSSWFCGFLSLVILFYINSFVMKRRKKEFGIYSILGMEKRHISILMFVEVLITGLTSILCGILFGALFSQFLFLLLLKIVGLPAMLTFQIPLSALAATAFLFAVCFLLVLLYDIASIMRTAPIAIMNSSKQGEREPKAHWLLALAGAISLGSGYILSFTVETLYDALDVFFIAVMLVIIGTYLLFMTGSIAVLKLLRKKKGFYYNPKNFISVSGMMYRMKQNAAGLATICILSTCVLVTLSSTVCLFIGEEDILKDQFPRQIEVACIVDGNSAQLVSAAARAHAQKYGFTVENPIGYYSLNFGASRNGDAFQPKEYYRTDGYGVMCIQLSDYNEILGTEKTLENGQVLAHIDGEQPHGGIIKFGDQSYQIEGSISDSEIGRLFGGQSNGNKSALLVFPSLNDLQNFKEHVNDILNKEDFTFVLGYDYKYDVAGDERKLPVFYTSMRAAFNETVPMLLKADNVDSVRDDFYQIYGSLLFVGIFFAALFLIAAILIIYYKQITEGFDDRSRFQIMRQVGMSDKEVRSTIQKQVLMVFFLPLGVAALHIAVAFRVLCKLLLVFSMTNTMLFFLCTLVTGVIFAALYFVVYQWTAHAYYRIVQ